MDLKRHIREIPDFPKPGILFYDISTLLKHRQAGRVAIDRVAGLAEELRPDVLVGIESRGFLFGVPAAVQLGLGFVMVRKVGKLPGAVISHDYDLEYGSDTIQIGDGLIERGQRVVLVDDLLATGGTAAAALELIRKVGGEPVGAVFVIELLALHGRGRIDVPVRSVLAYDR
jgi:adenine phosphoribosyltransferase